MSRRTISIGITPPALLFLLLVPVSAASDPVPDARARLRFAPPPPLVAPLVGHAAELRAAAPDGRWHAFGLLQNENHAALLDVARDRLISLGGLREGAFELPLSGTVAWRELASRPGQPWPVGWWASEYDPATGDLYFQAVGPGRTVVICRMDPATGEFAPIEAPGAPEYPYIPYVSMAFDPARQRFFLFGGQNYDFRLPDDLWVLDLLPTPHWSKWAPAGPSPQGRIGAALVLDPARDRLLMLGGLANVRPGVWALSLDANPTWSQLSTEALPGDANFNGMVMDRAADRVLALHPDGEVWAFSLRNDRWTVLPVAGPHPPGRILVPLVMDDARRRLIVAGGRTVAEDDLLNDAWALSLDGTPRWTPLVAVVPRPPLRASSAGALDAARRRLLLFGGSHELGHRNDTWALDLDRGRWTQVATEGAAPSGRYWHACAYDPIRDQLVVYGGYPSPGFPPGDLGDLWTLSFAGDTPRWRLHEPPGVRPSARSLTTLVYDPPGDRFILVHGSGPTGPRADVWELRFTPEATWRLMSPIGFPPPRVGAAAAYDAGRERMLLFGGYGATAPLHELWALDLRSREGSWYPIALAGPPARALPLLQVDATRQRALLFGGENGGLWSDVWEFTFTGEIAWRRLAPVGPAPGGRSRTVGAFDPTLDRLLLFGGHGFETSNDTWALEFGETGAPVQLALERVEVEPDRVRLRWVAGEPGLGVRLDRRENGGDWRAVAERVSGPDGRIEYEDRDVTAGARLSYRLAVVRNGEELLLGIASVTVPRWTLALAIATPSADVTFRLRLPSGLPATLTVYDVTGRRVWGREVGSLGPGEHAVHAAGANWRAGIYHARLVQGEHALTRRFAVLR